MTIEIFDAVDAGAEVESCCRVTWNLKKRLAARGVRFEIGIKPVLSLTKLSLLPETRIVAAAVPGSDASIENKV